MSNFSPDRFSKKYEFGLIFLQKFQTFLQFTFYPKLYPGPNLSYLVEYLPLHKCQYCIKKRKFRTAIINFQKYLFCYILNLHALFFCKKVKDFDNKEMQFSHAFFLVSTKFSLDIIIK